MERVPTCVWLISDALVLALDERFGDPIDAYVNGSQTWLLENGPLDTMVEWRLHPVPGYVRPARLATEDVFPSLARALLAGQPPVAPAAALWEGLEAFPAYGDDMEPAPLREAVTKALGLEPDAFGLADHQSIGDAWERSSGRVSIVQALLAQLGSTPG